MEIYNETIRDLLVRGTSDASKLELRENGRGNVTVPGLTQVRRCTVP
jgi:hypothetical protein